MQRVSSMIMNQLFYNYKYAFGRVEWREGEKRVSQLSLLIMLKIYGFLDLKHVSIPYVLVPSLTNFFCIKDSFTLFLTHTHTTLLFRSA